MTDPHPGGIVPTSREFHPDGITEKNRFHPSTMGFTYGAPIAGSTLRFDRQGKQRREEDKKMESREAGDRSQRAEKQKVRR